MLLVRKHALKYRVRDMRDAHHSWAAVNKPLVGEHGVHLDLVASDRDACRTLNVPDLRQCKVGDANIPREAFIDQRFHGSPASFNDELVS